MTQSALKEAVEYYTDQLDSHSLAFIESFKAQARAITVANGVLHAPASNTTLQRACQRLQVIIERLDVRDFFYCEETGLASPSKRELLAGDDSDGLTVRHVDSDAIVKKIIT